MNLPIKFPSDTEVILEEVARFQALTPRSDIRAIRRILNAGALILTEVAEGCLGQTVFRGTGTPRPTYHPGVHRTSCTLTATSCRTNWSRPLNPSPRHSLPGRSGYALIGGLAIRASRAPPIYPRRRLPTRSSADRVTWTARRPHRAGLHARPGGRHQAISSRSCRRFPVRPCSNRLAQAGTSPSTAEHSSMPRPWNGRRATRSAWPPPRGSS